MFVHGLRGASPRLPKKIPQARILTFGHDVNVWHFWSQPASDNTIKDDADTLTVHLSSLRYEKNQTIQVTAKRPLSYTISAITKTPNHNLQERCHAKVQEGEAESG